MLNRNLVYYFPAKAPRGGQLDKVINFYVLDAIVQMYDELGDAILLVNSTFTFQVVLS